MNDLLSATIVKNAGLTRFCVITYSSRVVSVLESFMHSRIFYFGCSQIDVVISVKLCYTWFSF